MQPETRLLEDESTPPSAPEERFSNFYRQHYWLVLAFAERRITNHETARDLTSETFRVAWSKFEEAEHMGLAFLYQTCKNLIGNEYRRQLRVAALEVKLQHCPERHAGDEHAVQLARGNAGHARRRTRNPVPDLLGGSSAPNNWPMVLGCSREAAWARVSRARKSLKNILRSGVHMRKQLFEDDGIARCRDPRRQPVPCRRSRRSWTNAPWTTWLPSLPNHLPPDASTDPLTEPGAGACKESMAPSNVVALDAKGKATRRWVLGALAAVAAGVLVAVPLGSSLNSTGKAVAAPLPLTSIKPAPLSTEQAVELLIAAAKANPDGADFNPGYFDIEHWEANSMFVPLDRPVPHIRLGTMMHPELVTMSGLTASRIRACRFPSRMKSDVKKTEAAASSKLSGIHFPSPVGSVEFVPFDGNARPGTVATHDFGPGGFTMMHRKAPPRTAKEFHDRIYGVLATRCRGSP